MDKQFKVASVCDPDRSHWLNHSVKQSTAAVMGWDNPGAGEQALAALSVGGTLTDEDGDTWERTA